MIRLSTATAGRRASPKHITRTLIGPRIVRDIGLVTVSPALGHVARERTESASEPTSSAVRSPPEPPRPLETR